MVLYHILIFFYDIETYCTDVKFHKLIVMEEIQFHNHNTAVLKRLLEGQIVQLDRKGLPANVCKFRGPVIMISNFPPPLHIDPALLSRFTVIHANTQYFIDDKCIFDPTVTLVPNLVLLP